MALALANLLNILASPDEVSAKLKEQPRWLAAFLVISFLSTALAWFLFPLSQKIAVEFLVDKLDERQVQRTIAAAERFKYVGFAFTPLTLLLRWSVVAALLYFSSVLIDTTGTLRFRTVYAVVVHSEVIMLLMGIVNLLILYIRGPESIHHITDLQAVVGLDILLANKSANLSLFTFLNSINIFTIWYVATLAIGISVITHFSKIKSTILVSIVWLLGIGYQVALMAISANLRIAPMG